MQVFETSSFWPWPGPSLGSPGLQGSVGFGRGAGSYGTKAAPSGRALGLLPVAVSVERAVAAIEQHLQLEHVVGSGRVWRRAESNGTLH